MRSVCLFLLVAACGDSSHAQPDAAAVADASFDTASGSGSAASDLDTTFGTSGTAAFTGTCQAFAVDASDRALVLAADGSGDATLSRLDATGHADASYAPVAIGTGPIAFSKLFVLPSGKVLVAGIFAHAGQNDDPHLYRLTAAGAIDLDLALPSPFRPVIGVGERADGGLDLVGPGNAFGTAFVFTRITAAGAVDQTFGNQGVALPATTDIPPGYFPHAVSLGNGSFALSGATFKAVNSQGGEGPVVGHLFLATDGAITKTTTVDDTQFLDLAGDGGKLYALTSAFPGYGGAIARFDSDLTADTTFTSAESSTYDPIYGLYNGGALAVAADGSLLATNAKTLDRFHADGTARNQDADAFTYCGVAFDSHDRPLIASSTAVLRLEP